MAAAAPKQAYIVPNQTSSGAKLPKVGSGLLTAGSAIPQPVKDTGGPIAIKTAPTAKNSSPPAASQGGSTVPQPVAAPPAAAPGAPAADPTPGAFAGIAPPGLTPDQAAAFNTAWSNYQASLGSDNANLAQAPITEAATVAKDKADYVANSETAQASAASRGIFSSSIKDGALNDIAATQASNDYIAAGQLSTLTAAINADIGRLNTNWGITATGAVGDAVINGQGVPPVVTPAAPAAPAAAAPAAPAAPAGGATKPGTNIPAGSPYNFGDSKVPGLAAVAKSKASAPVPYSFKDSKRPGL